MRKSVIVASIRAGTLALVTALALLLGAAVAHAATEFSVSKPDAAAGEEVPFKITGTEAWSSYELRLESEVVAVGTDPAGNGVDERFKMPDLGSAEKTVTLEVTVTQPSSSTPEIASTTMRYVLFPTTPVGPTTQPQPEPVVLKPEPVAQVAPIPPTKRSATAKPKTKVKVTPQAKKKPSSEVRHEKSGGSGGNSGGSGSTPNSTSSPSTTTGSFSTPGSSVSDKIVTNGKSTTAPAGTPSGPNGVGGIGGPPTTPPSGGSPLATTPISGVANVAGGGFPTALLVALLLGGVVLAIAALAAAATRLRGIDWHRFAFAGPVDDEVRLGALSRVSSSSAEAQRALAARKASRTNSGARPLRDIEP